MDSTQGGVTARGGMGAMGDVARGTLEVGEQTNSEIFVMDTQGSNLMFISSLFFFPIHSLSFRLHIERKPFKHQF